MEPKSLSGEWQVVGDSQPLPPGCHVRVDLLTGVKEARLIGPEAAPEDGAVVVAGDQSDKGTPTSASAKADSHSCEKGTATGPHMGQPRDPRDWQGLLKWSLSYIDNTQPSTHTEMDPERKKWLMRALEALSTDEIKLMKDALEVLCQDYVGCFDKTLSPDQLLCKERALEQLEELVDLLGNAQDMIPLGGFPAVIGLLGAAYPTLQWRAASILATCMQNNPVCQEYALAHEVMGKLIDMLKEPSDVMVEVKALYALGGLVRSHEAALKAFFLANGLDVLRHAAAQFKDKPKVAIKAVFLMGQLIHSSLVSAELAVQSGIVPVTGQVLQTEDVQLRESSLDLLAALTTAPSFVSSAVQPGVDIGKRVSEVKTLLSQMAEEDRDAYREDLENIDTILKALE